MAASTAAPRPLSRPRAAATLKARVRRPLCLSRASSCQPPEAVPSTAGGNGQRSFPGMLSTALPVGAGRGSQPSSRTGSGVSRRQGQTAGTARRGALAAGVSETGRRQGVGDRIFVPDVYTQCSVPTLRVSSRPASICKPYLASRGSVPARRGSPMASKQITTAPSPERCQLHAQSSARGGVRYPRRQRRTTSVVRDLAYAIGRTS